MHLNHLTCGLLSVQNLWHFISMFVSVSAEVSLDTKAWKHDFAMRSHGFSALVWSGIGISGLSSMLLLQLDMAGAVRAGPRRKHARPCRSSV